MKKRIAMFDIRGYYKPTPIKMRKIGDAMLGVSQFMTGYSIVMDEKWLALICIAVGSMGKFLTNFYTEVPNEYQQTTHTNQA